MRLRMRRWTRLLQAAAAMAWLLLGGTAGATTVTASPGTCTSVNDGGGDWSRASRAVSSNNSHARAQTDGTATDYLRCTNYGFSIPAGATINGITVYVERRSDRTSNGGSKDSAVRVVKAGVIGADNQASSTIYTTSDVVEAHGGSGYLWGAGWTAADINDPGFGAAFKAVKASSSGESHEIRVDHIYIAVDYTFSYPPGVYTVTGSPSACSNVGGIGTLAWSNTGYALASDDQRSSVSVWDYGTFATNYLVCTGYGFSVPSEATINGITIDVERRVSSSGSITARDYAVRVVKGGVIGTTDGSSATTYTTTDTYGSHGGTGSLWGTAWTPADINAANFGAAFSATMTKTNWSTRRIYVDHLRVSVTFTVPPAVVMPSEFNAYDSGTSPAGSLTGKLMTKVAGQTFSFDIVALNTTRTALLSTYTQKVKVELLDASAGGTLDGNNCNAAWPVIQALSDQTFTGNAGGATDDRTVTGSAGRHRVGGVVVANSWRNVTVRVSYPASGTPTVIGCSTDHFAIRPSSLSGLSITDSDWDSPGTSRSLNNLNIAGTVVHKAGRPFTVQALAVNAASTTTTNYAGAPVGVFADCSGGTGGTACTSAFGTFVLGSPAVAGVIDSTTASYNEVGAYTLQLQDQSFADIDAADGSEASCAGRYVCSGTVDVGRFVPDHFDVAAVSLINRADLTPTATATTADAASGETSLLVSSVTGFPVGVRVRIPAAGTDGDALYATVAALGGSSLTLDTPLLADLPAGSDIFVDPGFTYLGERLDIGLSLRARAADNALTANYQGSLARLDPLAAGNPLGVGAVDNGTTRLAFPVCGGTPAHPCFTPAAATGGSFVAGVADDIAVPLVFHRGTTAVGPLVALDIGIAPLDADGVGMLTYDLDTDATSGNDHSLVARAELRYGRMRLGNAYGSELLPLPIVATAQYWNGSGFVANILDSQTAFLPADIAFSNFRLNLTPALVSVVTPPATVALTKGAGRFTLAAPGANKNGSVDFITSAPTYLPSNQARAVFGAYKSPAIYRRENY